MKTLEQHNQDRQANYAGYQGQRGGPDEPAGIECPRCKSELRIDLQGAYMTLHPMRRVRCNGCEFEGYALD